MSNTRQEERWQPSDRLTDEPDPGEDPAAHLEQTLVDAGMEVERWRCGSGWAFRTAFDAVAKAELLVGAVPPAGDDVALLVLGPRLDRQQLHELLTGIESGELAGPMPRWAAAVETSPAAEAVARQVGEERAVRLLLRDAPELGVLRLYPLPAPAVRLRRQLLADRVPVREEPGHLRHRARYFKKQFGDG